LAVSGKSKRVLAKMDLKRTSFRSFGAEGDRGLVYSNGEYGGLKAKNAIKKAEFRPKVLI
jgi:hypothetical protein